MSLTNQLGHCDQCGIKLEFDSPEQEKKSNDYQKDYSWNKNVQVCCDDCIEKGHTITDEELAGIKRITVN